MLLKITALGRSAHGARPWEGRSNAVAEIFALLASFSDLRFPSYKNMPEQPLVPLSIKEAIEKYSLSVPDNCSCVISKRLVQERQRKAFLQR